MATKSGTADLPLHHGRVPMWLARRMSLLSAAIAEAIVEASGPDEFLRRLCDPAWFQAFGAVLGMDWHSSGMTTAVMGALKRGLAGRERDLEIYVCGGRGRHSRKTPEELMQVAEATGLDGNALAQTSRLVAKVDNAAVADGFNLYLHGFVVTTRGKWVVIQQGMRPETGMARRYHWRSETVRSFVDEPHEGIVGIPQGSILNLTDHRAEPARQAICTLSREPDFVIREIENLRHIDLPTRHDVQLSDLFVRRLQAVLQLAREQDIKTFDRLLVVPGMGPRSVQALALVSEIVYGKPSRFSDPARFSFAHGGKDGFPHPVLTTVYDQTIESLRSALRDARIGRSDKIDAFARLESEVKRQQRLCRRLSPDEERRLVDQTLARGRREAIFLGGMTVGKGPSPSPHKPLESSGENGVGKRRITPPKRDNPRKRRAQDRPVQLLLPGMPSKKTTP